MTDLYRELGAPAQIAPNTIRITPLGGLGEVGRNMSVLELNGRLLLVDCGVIFPEDHQPGVDLILPDMQMLESRLDDIEALVLTHGHEDHIGAVPYLLRLREDIPIYGSKLTLALTEAKVREHRLNPLFVEVDDNARTQVGEFNIEFCAVNHSIPDALAVFVRTVAGNVLITGDFKMDQLPIDRRITDLRAFARFGEEGVDLFMVDSTNAEVPGFVASEKEIAPAIDRVFAESPKKIVVASFSSHVHRVQQVIAAAHRYGRKVVLVGRSMVRNMKIAGEIGYLEIPNDVLLEQHLAKDYPAEKLVFMCTGSQGEPMAALSRMARGEHSVKIEAEDTVVLASSLIPGNENSVGRVINQITVLGARVVHRGNAKVHVSGHSAQGELIYCYNIVRPKNVMPIHGEVRHLVANGSIAVKTGIDPKRVLLAEDGVSVDLAAGDAHISGAIDCGYVYVDGSSVGEIGEDELRDRLILSKEGFISVVCVVDLKNKSLVSGPFVAQRGMAEDDESIQEIIPTLKEGILENLKDDVSAHALQQIMRRIVGRFAANVLRRRPMIVPMIIDTANSVTGKKETDCR